MKNQLKERMLDLLVDYKTQTIEELWNIFKKIVQKNVFSMNSIFIEADDVTHWNFISVILFTQNLIELRCVYDASTAHILLITELQDMWGKRLHLAWYRLVWDVVRKVPI